MSFRQVHLDFHTSEAIEKIGKQFDKKQFQERLAAGHVGSMNIFAKCHHGWAYFPSETNEMHPHLDFDLLGGMLAACEEIGVRNQIYISAGLDEKYVQVHQNHAVRNRDQTTTWAPAFGMAGYHRICMNTPYLSLLAEQVREVVEKYKTDGYWLDIVGELDCYCETCREMMSDRGMDIENPADVKRWTSETYKKYYTTINDVILSVNPDLKIAHNCGHITRGRRDLVAANTHVELESLPTGGWGYNHFPLSARYVNKLGIDYLGMTGKFHKSWGEFGGFKHPNALRYEAGLNLTLGAKMCVGDQMHPAGFLDEVTYNLIGAAYKEVEAKESWCDGVTSIADIGLLSREAVESLLPFRRKAATQSSTKIAKIVTGLTADGVSEETILRNQELMDSMTALVGREREEGNLTDQGALSILQEGHYLFDVIDTYHGFSAYKVIVLPDSISLNDELAANLRNYVAGGGKILATGRSGLDRDESGFLLDFGVEYLGPGEYSPDYLRPEFSFHGLGHSSFVMYGQGSLIKTKDGAQVQILGQRENPLFNRSAEHFSSHAHTPNSLSDISPGIVQNETGIYIAWDIFESYRKDGSLIIKEVVSYVLDRLLGDEKTIHCNMGDQGIITLMDQTAEGRYVNHLLYGSPIKKGAVEVITDLVAIRDTHVDVKTQKPVKRVYLAPEGKEIPFTTSGDTVSYRVEEFHCHQMVVLDYE